MLRVILDTNVLRQLYEREISVKDFFTIPGSRKFKYSIAPYFYAEFINQLCHSPNLFEKWLKVRQEVDALVDRNWPILPHGYNYGVIAGIYKNDGTVSFEKTRAHFEEQWFCFITSPSYDFFLGHIVGGKDQAQAFVDEKRDYWVNWITKTKEDLLASVKPKQRPTKADLYEYALQMTKRAGDNVQTAEYFEAYYKLLAHYTWLHLYGRTTYNPNSNRNYGDMIDMEALSFAPLPVILVTHDEKFRGRVRDANSEFAKRMFLPEEFIRMKGDDLDSLVTEQRRRVDQLPESVSRDLRAIVG